MFEEAVPRCESSGAQPASPIAHRLVNLARLRPGDQVLDIGCGSGAVTIRSAGAVSPGGHCAIACRPPESHDTGKAAVR